ncbi:MAG: hypothetical protein ACOYVD_02625 [Bacillota bacterium]
MYRQMFMPGQQFQPIPGQTFEPTPGPGPTPTPYMGYPTSPVYEMGPMYPTEPMMPMMYPTMDQIYLMLQDTLTMLQRIYEHETQPHV